MSAVLRSALSKSVVSERAVPNRAVPNRAGLQAGQATWTFLARLLLLWLISLLGILILHLLSGRVMMPTLQEEMAQTQILAYRGWQSTGVRLQAGESAEIRAKGQWLYTPGEWHDANGHKRYPAPNFYPMTGVAGGVLLGRVGDEGSIQWVGTRGRIYTSEGGMLYLRINDDILSDNEGSLQVAIEVIPAPVP
jgi:hypothetical protein